VEIVKDEIDFQSVYRLVINDEVKEKFDYLALKSQNQEILYFNGLFAVKFFKNYKTMTVFVWKGKQIMRFGMDKMSGEWCIINPWAIENYSLMKEALETVVSDIDYIVCQVMFEEYVIPGRDIRNE